jgi:aminomethyltransferase
VTSGTIAGVNVDISRTGYTGDLGYEIWMPANRALSVWDALMDGGGPFDIKPAGMLALDVARIEAGLLLIEVDFFSSRKAIDRVPDVHTVRAGDGPPGEPEQGPLHRPARAARGAGPLPRAPDRGSRDRLE